MLEIVNTLTVNHPNVLSLTGYQKRNAEGTMSFIFPLFLNSSCDRHMRSLLEATGKGERSQADLVTLSNSWVSALSFLADQIRLIVETRS